VLVVCQRSDIINKVQGVHRRASTVSLQGTEVEGISVWREDDGLFGGERM
jgi:hypothetical protein